MSASCSPARRPASIATRASPIICPTCAAFPAGSETAPAAKSILDFANGQQQATLESPDEIMALIDGKKAPAKRIARRDK
jgi:hypothetical protein